MEVNHLKNGGSFRMMINHWLKNGWFLNQLIKRFWPRTSRFFSQKAWFQHLLLCRDFGVRLASVPTGEFPWFPKPNQKISSLLEGFYTSPDVTQGHGDLKVLLTIFFAKIPSTVTGWRIHCSIHPSSIPPSASRTLLGTAVLPAASSGPIPCRRNLPRPCRRPRRSIRWGGVGVQWWCGLFGDGRKHQWTYI